MIRRGGSVRQPKTSHDSRKGRGAWWKKRVWGGDAEKDPRTLLKSSMLARFSANGRAGFSGKGRKAELSKRNAVLLYCQKLSRDQNKMTRWGGRQRRKKRGVLGGFSAFRSTRKRGSGAATEGKSGTKINKTAEERGDRLFLQNSHPPGDSGEKKGGGHAQKKQTIRPKGTPHLPPILKRGKGTTHFTRIKRGPKNQAKEKKRGRGLSERKILTFYFWKKALASSDTRDHEGGLRGEREGRKTPPWKYIPYGEKGSGPYQILLHRRGAPPPAGGDKKPITVWGERERPPFCEPAWLRPESDAGNDECHAERRMELGKRKKKRTSSLLHENLCERPREEKKDCAAEKREKESTS